MRRRRKSVAVKMAVDRALTITGCWQHGGLQSFDNVAAALLVVLQYVLSDHGYDPLHLALAAEPATAALIWSFFTAATFFGTLLALGVCITVVLEAHRRAANRDAARRRVGKAAAGVNVARADPVALKLAAERASGGRHGRVHPHQLSFGAAGSAAAVLEAAAADQSAHGAARRIQNSLLYRRGVALLIILHAVAIAADAGEPQTSLQAGIATVNVVANGLFCADYVMSYLSTVRRLDFVLQPSSLSELVLLACGLAGLWRGSVSLSAVPAARVLRLAARVPALAVLMQSALSGSFALAQLALVAAVACAAAGTAGRYIVGGGVLGISRAGYGTMLDALLTSFQLLTGDGWSGIVYGAMEAHEDPASQAYAGLCVLVWVLVGRTVLAGLFIAVAAEAFNLLDERAAIAAPGRASAMLAGLHNAGYALMRAMEAVARADDDREPAPSEAGHVSSAGRGKAKGARGWALGSSTERRLKTGSGYAATYAVATVAAQRKRILSASLGDGMSTRSAGQESEVETTDDLSWVATVAIQPIQTVLMAALPLPTMLDVGFEAGFEAGGRLGQTNTKYGGRATHTGSSSGPAVATLGVQAGRVAVEVPFTERTLFLLRPSNPLRLLFVRAARSSAIGLLVHLCVLLNSALLVLIPAAEDMPGQPAPPISPETRQIIDLATTCVFSAELVIAVAAQGLLFTEAAYLKSGWNIVDLLVLGAAWASFGAEHQGINLSGGSLLKVLRLARILRPLRLVKGNQNLRVMLEALFCTLLPALYVCVLALLLCFVGALIGRAIFGGQFFRCSFDVTYPAGKAVCSGVQLDLEIGVMLPRVWISPAYNFDDIGRSVMTMLRVNSNKMADIYRDGMDITGQDQSPYHNFSQGNSIFFVAYVVLANFFVMNVFASFLIQGFHVQNRSSTSVDAAYLLFQREIRRIQPSIRRFVPPHHHISRVMRKIAGARVFGAVSTTCILINVLLMLSDNSDKPGWLATLLFVQGCVFLVVLALEVTVTLIGFGFGVLFDDHWKLFDAIILVGASVGIFVDRKFTAVFQPMRIVVTSMIELMPKMANICLLLLLVLWMFASFAVHQFGVIKFGQRVGPTANFETFAAALATGYQIIFGDEWMNIVDDSSVQWPYCTIQFNSDHLFNYTGKQYSFGDCGNSYSFVYIAIFKLLCQYMLLYLCLGVIIEELKSVTDELGHAEDSAWQRGATADQIQGLALIFERFAAGTATISIEAAVSALLWEFPTPLGFNVGLGCHEREAYDRAAQKMIRAELSLLLRQRFTIEASKRKNGDTIWKRAISAVTSGSWVDAPRRFVNGITFEEAMQTTFYWRKPSLIPEWAKISRIEMLEEAYLMACALTVRDFLRGLVAQRKCNELGNHVRDLFRLRQWARADRHRLRISALYGVVRADIMAQSERLGIDPSEFFYSPAAKVSVTLEPIVGTMDQQVHLHERAAHFDANAQSLVDTAVPRPSSGLDAFRRRAAQQIVVCRFIHPAAQPHRPGIFKVDLRACNWGGWQVTHAKYDTLLVPRRARHTKDEAYQSWLEVELVIKPSPAPSRGRSLRKGSYVGGWDAGGNRLYSPGAARSGLAGSSGLGTGSGVASSGFGSGTADDVWVVLDVQSYIEGSADGEPNASPRSVVRVNVCRRRNLDMLDPREQREMHPDGALEVVGYMQLRTEESG